MAHKAMTQDEKYREMTEEPVKSLVIRLAVPTIISMLVSSFYNMADTFFVGKINTQATAAVGVVFSMMAIIQALGFLFGQGSGNYISRKLGAHETEEAEKMATCAFAYAFLCGVAVMILGLVFLEPLARGLGSTKTILPYAKTYLSTILIGAPYMTASLVLNNQLRFQGNAFYAMIGIVSGAVINIGLDPVFIFGLHMGIGGAALATIISQFVSFCLLLLGTTKGGSIRLRPANLEFRWHWLKEILKGGLPSLFRQGIASVATIFLNQCAGNYGDAAIAGMSIVSRITMFANSALIGFGQGFQPVCGFNYGAKKYVRVQEAFFFCVKYAFAFLLVVAAIGYCFAPQLVELFRKGDADVIAVGSVALRMQCLTFSLNAWIVMCNMMLQSAGRGLPASILALARQGLFFLPILWVLSSGMGLHGIQITQPIADVCTFLLSIPMGILFLKGLNIDN